MQGEEGTAIEPHKLQLVIPYHCWRQMHSLAAACATEVNGFGYIRHLFGGIFKLQEVFILEQVATPWSAETVDTALLAHLAKMHEEGIPSELLRFQWHSHGDAASFFSNTDNANIERWPGDWLMSLVINRRGEAVCRYDHFAGGLRLKAEVAIVISFPGLSPAELQWAARQLAAHVQTPSMALPAPTQPREENGPTQLHAPNRVF